MQALFQFDLRGPEYATEVGSSVADVCRTELFAGKEFNEHGVANTMDRALNVIEREVIEFATRLVDGTLQHRDDIDALLQGVTRNWDLRRMAIVDRNVLRMAVFELKFCADVPPHRSPTLAGQMVFGKLLKALKKTRDVLTTGLARLFKGRQLDDAFLDELEELLYNSDLGPLGTKIVDELKISYKKKEIKETEEVPAFLRVKLLEMMAGCEGEITRAATGPTVILVVGVNGAGKTTSIAKLANYLKKEGNTVLLGAGDTFRAAAIEQLTLWSERLGIEIVKQETGADPAAVAFDATAAAIARKVDYLILDTAGRLHTQKNLMTELEKIVRVVKKQLPDAPHETLLVLDGTTGQNAIRQASEFQKSAPVTGLILAKMDGTAKGGALFGIREVLPVPVKFLGVGEGIDDLEKFVVQDYVDAILRFDVETTA
jgi:fused signal recognition particle receptor